MKTGLVLEGGAMRGMFTAGVIDVFMENGIEFDGLIGVSAGALFGCNYKSKQIGRVIRYNKAFCKDKRYCSFRSLIKTGDLFGADFCYREIPQKLDIFDFETYEKNPMDFYVVCSDVETGKPVYKLINKIVDGNLDWYRASASLPLVAEVVEVDGYKLLDGGLTDSIPLKYFESIGYDKNVVITTQPEGYVKKKNKAIPLVKLALKKYPEIIKAAKKRHIMYNSTLRYLKYQEEKGNAYVIRPETSLGIGHVEHNPDNLQRVYELGRQAGEKHLESVKRYLSQDSIK